MTSHRQRGLNEKGTVLMACIILSLLVVSLVFWSSYWAWDRTRTDVSQAALQYARQYADSGLSAASPWLRTPSLKTTLPAGTSNSFSLSMPNGRVDVALYRTSSDTSLVDTYATGYYFIPRGSIIDPQTGNAAQECVISGMFRIANVSDYLLASPGSLSVGAGTQASNGMVYAQNLSFESSSNPNIPQTSIMTAYYYNSVLPADLSFVQFTSTPSSPQQLSYPPSFAALDPTMRGYYSSIAGSGTTPAMSGTVSAPPSNVYFVTGDLDVAMGQPLVVQGIYVIYVTGSVYIHNNIVLADSNSWIAILSEQNTHLASDAPNALTLNGTFVSNGPFTADLVNGLPRSSPNSLTINGGIVSMTTIAVSIVYPGSRSYTYASTSNPNLLLPNMTTALQYAVLSGQGSLR